MAKAGTSKGQVISTELVLTFGIFMVALLVFLYIWSEVSYDYLQSQVDQEMQVVALGISDSLVLTPGDPSDWEISSSVSSIYSFGLASSPNVLSAAKLSKLQSFNTSYSDAKTGMGAGSFEVSVIANTLNGTPIYQFGTHGDELAQNISSIKETRLVMLEDGALMQLSIQIWRIKG